MSSMQPVKVVGRRRESERATSAEAFAWQTRAATLFGRRPLCARGVFRFRTFEEAEEWMQMQMARNARAVRRQRTSQG